MTQPDPTRSANSVTEGIRQGYRFQEHTLFLYFPGQVLMESLVKGSQTRYDEQEYSPSRVALLDIISVFAAPAPGGATRIFFSQLHDSCLLTTGALPF